MNFLWIVLFLIAAFHFCLYYCNVDLFTKKQEPVPVDVDLKLKLKLSESKEILEKHLKELKQFSSINTHG